MFSMYVFVGVYLRVSWLFLEHVLCVAFCVLCSGRIVVRVRVALLMRGVVCVMSCDVNFCVRCLCVLCDEVLLICVLCLC